MDPWSMLYYPLEDYPFPTLVADTLGIDDLTGLSANLARRTWRTDQQSPWHGFFYSAFDSWRDVYVALVREVIAPHVGEPFYYQNVPTFRVQLPGNVAVGEFHTDAQYHHPLGEQSFWLPLTHAYGTCTLWIADDDDELHAVDARPGQIAQFAAVTRRHGNKLNQTGRSRVSFDFRCLPVRLLPAVEGPPTEHSRLRFIPGGYYAPEAVTP